MNWRLIFLLFHMVQKEAISEKVCLGETDPRGALYQGKLQRSSSGKRCITWQLANSASGITWVHNPESKHRNYCRNPGGDHEKPWCYVTRESWEFCNVKDCDDMCGAQTITPLFSNQQYYIREGKLLARKRVKRVIGGDVATHGSWPWVVSVRLARDGPHYCGGALIRKSWVLTAAHCVDSHAGISRMGVYAGHQLGTEAETQISGIRRIILHPGYSSDLVNKDIALIQLQTPFKMTTHVRFACLPSPSYIVPTGTNCVYAGWGYNGGRSYPRQLKQVVLPVNSYNFCRREMGRDMEDRTQMCAGWNGRGHGTCSGDSGGPLFCLGAQTRRWTIQGINSWSMSLCSDGDGGIEAYTRVSKFVRWIKQQISDYRTE